MAQIDHGAIVNCHLAAVCYRTNAEILRGLAGNPPDLSRAETDHVDNRILTDLRSRHGAR